VSGRILVGLIGLGEMGAALGGRLASAGFDVAADASGRSEQSQQRARAAGIDLDRSLAGLVADARVVLSVVPPAVAVEVAREVAGAIGGRPRADLVYVDCNAVSPVTALEVERVIVEAGVRVADAAILGGPPTGTRPSPYVPVSGDGAAEVCDALGAVLDVRDIGGPVGRASALKMCYAALTKGGSALHLELLAAAERLGVADELHEHLAEKAPAQLAIMSAALPRVPARAWRWVAEMDEIAATFESVGLTPLMLAGAAEIYREVEHGYQPGQDLDDPRKVARIIGQKEK
jgi:3-hydroxyisobutyrate dehydrogenase-like beta-hydroxyacid dehydrogenase